MHKNLTFIIATLIILITSSAIMAFYFSKTLDQNEFKSLILESDEIKNIKILNFTFPVNEIKNKLFLNSEWEDINSEGSFFENVEFNNCSFKNVNLRHSTLINVTFNNCTLTNVVLNNSTIKNLKFIKTKLISTDSNVQNSYRELNADTIIFKESELENINFFDSKANFSFIDSKLNDVTGMGLMAGSSLVFDNTNAFDIDFSSSKLQRLEVKRSHIKQSKANNCTIGTLILEDSILDFPIAQGNAYDNVISKNTKDVVISGTPTKNVNISSCPEDTRILMVGGDKFDNIKITDCSPDEIIFFESDGRFISIENANVYTMDFSASKIDHLKLNNIHIKTELYYDSSNIKKLEATNITFGENIEHTHKNSNIEIKENKAPQDAQ